MIYTIGNKKAYDALLQERGSLRKGKTGSVWRTLEDAVSYINGGGLTGFQVYAVEADWERDTDEIKGEAWRALNKSAKIILL